jgi:hypothetical protein
MMRGKRCYGQPIMTLDHYMNGLPPIRRRGMRQFYDVCGCDACHWEVYNFGIFYLFKNWDVEKPKWVFGIRKR